MMLSAPARSPRTGLSLLEVLVALAIFLFSIVALHQALNIGTNNAVDMQQHMSRVTWLKADMEVYVARPHELAADTPFDEDPDYTWSLDAEQNTTANLGTSRSRDAPRRRPKIETKLSQMIRPQHSRHQL